MKEFRQFYIATSKEYMYCFLFKDTYINLEYFVAHNTQTVVRHYGENDYRTNKIITI